MKSLADQMAIYAAYHQDRRNKATHFDVPLGAAMLVFTAALVWLGERIASQGAVHGWTWFAVLFLGGWILQLAGHVFEGRRPALADNRFQIFVAPIFLAAEVFFALGYKPRLKEEVQRRALELRDRALTPISGLA